jgi:isopentenyl-diphosphate delta-isomerase
MTNSSKSFKKVTVVDAKDQVIDHLDLYDALAAGHIRRVSLVYIFNESGELLLQKRPDWVLDPHKWSQSAAGHVNEGSDYANTAKEELQEELGLTLPLKEVGLALPTPGFFNGIYKATIPDGIPINYDQEEVAGVRWVPLKTLEDELISNPDTYTDSFKAAWSAYRDKILAA